jgi:hypothetical protein
MKFAAMSILSAAVIAPSIAFAAPRSEVRQAGVSNAAATGRVKAPSTHTRYIPASSPIRSEGTSLSHTFSPFNKVVDNQSAVTGLDPEFQALAGAPAGTYTGYTVTVDWSAIAGDPWSEEAIWAFADTNSLATATTFYADPGVAVDATNNGSPVSLAWEGFFDVPYAGGDPLFMLLAQTFSGSSANWNNVSIEINDNVPVIPPSIPAIQNNAATTTLPLSAGEVKWLSFNYSGSGIITIDTVGSSLTSTDPQDFADDTEIALYSSLGTLIDTNDDIDFAGGVYQSELFFASGELPAGTYYLAVTGWPAGFGPAFGASSTSVHSGSLVLNGISLIPEPTTLGLIAAAGMILGRRRR